MWVTFAPQARAISRPSPPSRFPVLTVRPSWRRRAISRPLQPSRFLVLTVRPSWRRRAVRNQIDILDEIAPGQETPTTGHFATLLNVLNAPMRLLPIGAASHRKASLCKLPLGCLARDFLHTSLFYNLGPWDLATPLTLIQSSSASNRRELQGTSGNLQESRILLKNIKNDFSDDEIG